jgi:hypothetical protein
MNDERGDGPYLGSVPLPAGCARPADGGRERERKTRRGGVRFYVTFISSEWILAASTSAEVLVWRKQRQATMGFWVPGCAPVSPMLPACVRRVI